MGPGRLTSAPYSIDEGVKPKADDCLRLVSLTMRIPSGLMVLHITLDPAFDQIAFGVGFHQRERRCLRALSEGRGISPHTSSASREVALSGWVV